MKTRFLLLAALLLVGALTRPTLANGISDVRVVEIEHEPTSGDAGNAPLDQDGYYLMLTKAHSKFLAGPFNPASASSVGAMFVKFLDGYDPGAKLLAIYQIYFAPAPWGRGPAGMSRVPSAWIPSLFGAEGAGKTIEDLFGKGRLDDQFEDRVRVARISHDPTIQDVQDAYPFSWRRGEYFILKSHKKKYVVGPFSPSYSPTHESTQSQILAFLNKASRDTRVTAAYLVIPTFGVGIRRMTAEEITTRYALGSWYDPE